MMKTNLWRDVTNASSSPCDRTRTKQEPRHPLSRLLLKSCILLFVYLVSIHSAQGADITLGLKFGYRELKDSHLAGIYGSGTVFVPHARLALSRYVSVEAAYEGGYTKSGLVGIYREPSTLNITGWEMSGLLGYPIKGVVPYLKLGLGYFHYRQDIDSPFVRLKVDHHHAATLAGAGTDIRLSRRLAVSAEVQYVPLKVKPYDIEVDLGGLRLLVGFSYQITL